MGKTAQCDNIKNGRQNYCSNMGNKSQQLVDLDICFSTKKTVFGVFIIKLGTNFDIPMLKFLHTCELIQLLGVMFHLVRDGSKLGFGIAIHWKIFIQR
jgi:hypothetical protein